MLAMQRGEGRVADTERERTCGCRERKDVRMQRKEGCGVGNGLDRDSVDVVVDVVNMPVCGAPASQVLLPKATPRWNTTSGI